MSIKESASKVLEKLKSETQSRTDRERTQFLSVHDPLKKKETRERLFTGNYLKKRDEIKGCEEHFLVNSFVNTSETDALQSVAKVKDWDEETKALIAYFEKQQKLPNAPFKLKNAVTVIDSNKFFDSLRSDIKDSPNGARSRFGALQDDLKCLKKIIEALNGN